MRIAIIILVFLVVFFPVYINVSAFAAQEKESPANYQFKAINPVKESFMPVIVEHEGSFYMRDPYWEEYEEAVYADVDGDSTDELIVRFRTKEEDLFPIAMTVIYGINKGDKLIAKTILGGETPKDMKLFDIDKDGIKDLILYDHCGNHYTLIMIYSYKDGEYKCIFENGTACYLYKVDTGLDPVRITIGREDWENEDFNYAVSETMSLLEVWEWDGKEFIHQPSLSTSPFLTEEEALEVSWQNTKRLMEEKILKEYNKSVTHLTKDDIDNENIEAVSKLYTAGRRYFKFIEEEDLK